MFAKQMGWWRMNIEKKQEFEDGEKRCIKRCGKHIQKPVTDPKWEKNVKNIKPNKGESLFDVLTPYFGMIFGNCQNYRFKNTSTILNKMTNIKINYQNSTNTCILISFQEKNLPVILCKYRISNKTIYCLKFINTMQWNSGCLFFFPFFLFQEHNVTQSYNQYRMLANSNGKFEQLLTQLLIDRRFEQAMEEGVEKYQIKQFKIASLPPNKIAEMYYHITTKFYFNHSTEATQAWHENELRVFIYLLVGYCFLQKKYIYQLDDDDWQFFSDIFNKRDPILFEFQGLSLLKKNSKCNKWELEEVSLLDSIIKAKSIKNKWNQIARDLFVRSKKKFFKTAKQCREYWINHLDPVPVRSSWSISQDYELVSAVVKLGKKWAKVSKLLGGKRTEHMVKNRFKSLFHFESKQRQYFQGNQSSQEEIIQAMLRKFWNGKQQQVKLSMFQNELKGHQNLNLMNTFDGKASTFNEEENDDLEKCKQQGKEKKGKDQNPLPNNSKQEFYQYNHNLSQTKHSFNSFKEIAIEDCISLYFEHDSFLGCPSNL